MVKQLYCNLQINYDYLIQSIENGIHSRVLMSYSNLNILSFTTNANELFEPIYTANEFTIGKWGMDDHFVLIPSEASGDEIRPLMLLKSIIK